ncbi:aminoglycoside phosphotransferase family protein [Citrobacter sp. Igbk 16]|uniref:aminoglycoside phosphotransferase family protein n=1 Tax=Citrobacter sp. Igbk 16 TaxID=2963958 RepID=UPI0023036E7C|nr:aminoglycoside phosphotransferase family protein [Citrobacter sp. Igbk 16]MDA8518833.1 APH(6) family putative aminoglycoside O-phosphotransferase [Citrobacter sp. Igbk 16]
MGKCMFQTWLRHWALIPDGNPVMTRTSALLPVTTIKEGRKAMLKLTDDEIERTGGELMVWWNGSGAAQVIAHDHGATLLVRATGADSLSAMSRTGEDAQACRILCNTARQLHRPANASTPVLTPLRHWFRHLAPAAKIYGGVMTRCAEIANELFSSPQDEVVLHGDLHHGNVLDFGPAGWLAIDPKGLLGERGFDYANIFTNPDLADPRVAIATDPNIFKQRVQLVSEIAGIERQRLLMWIAAWCGLSSAWFLEDGENAAITLRVAELAIAELDEESRQL